MKSSASKIKMKSFDDLFDTNETKSTSDTFIVTDIDIEEIVFNEDNFYQVKELEKLKMSIKAVGLKHNLIVRKHKEDETIYKYELISGHRRLKAIQELIEEGELDWSTVPCTIDDKSDLEQRLTLILANSTSRELSSFEKMKQIEEMKIIFKDIKEHDSTKFKGKTRDYIAEFLEMSIGEVARYEAINNNLDENIKKEFKEENISTDTAYAISRLEPDKQEKVKEAIKEAKEENRKITTKDVKTIAQKENNIDGSVEVAEDWIFENQIDIIDNENFETTKEDIEEIETNDEICENTQGFVDEKVNIDELDLEPVLTFESISEMLEKTKEILEQKIVFLKRQDKEFTATIDMKVEEIKNHKFIILALDKLLDSMIEYY